MDKILYGTGFSVIVIAVAVVISLLIALPVMLIWNAVMPDVFGLPIITFWQALGLCALSTLLIKSSNNSNKK